MNISRVATTFLADASQLHSAPSASRDLLPVPGTLGDADPGAEIAMLLFRAEKERRGEVKERIRANAETERREQEAQLEDMTSKARAALASGLASGLATGASGVLSFMEVKPLAEGTGNLSEGKAACHNAAEVKKLSAWSMAADAAGKLSSASLSSVSEGFNTDATRHGQAASRAQETRQTLQSDLAEIKDTMNKALQFMSEFRKQQAEIALSIWRR